MRTFFYVGLVCFLGLGLTAPTEASAVKRQGKLPKKVELEYKLPKARTGFAVAHTITGCPGEVVSDPNNEGQQTVSKLTLEATTAITPVYAPDETVKINAKGNLFVDRSIEIEYFKNGTIKSFNGTSTGQGGAFVSSVISLATFVASSAVGVPSSGPSPSLRPTLRCTEKVKRTLRQIKDVKSYLAGLESKIFASGETEDLLKQIADARKAISALEADLTIKGKTVFWDPDEDAKNTAPDDCRTKTVAADGKPNWTCIASAGSMSVWFEPHPFSGELSDQEVWRGLTEYGYGQLKDFSLTATFKPQEGSSNDFTFDSNKSYRALVYRAPVKATVTIKPKHNFDDSLATKLSPTERGLARQHHKSTARKKLVSIPQLGGYRAIRFDGSGMFGSKSVSATFTEAGELESISYTSGGGSDKIAGVIDTITASGGTLRDARLNAIKREVELLTKEKELEKMIEGEAGGEAEPAADTTSSQSPE